MRVSYMGVVGYVDQQSASIDHKHFHHHYHHHFGRLGPSYSSRGIARDRERDIYIERERGERGREGERERGGRER